MIVLDTNVLLEGLRPRPSATVLRWMQSEPVTVLFTTTITEAEMFYGAALLPDGRRRQSLEAVLTQLFMVQFASRILPFDSAAAREFANIAATRRRAGQPIGGRMGASRRSPDLAAPVWRRAILAISSVAGCR